MIDQRTPLATLDFENLPASARKPIRKLKHNAYKCPAYGETKTSRLTQTTAHTPARGALGAGNNSPAWATPHASNHQQFVSNREAPAAHALHITLKDHTDAACKLVILALRDYGFRILRQTKRGGVITAHVRYCASDMAEALIEVAKVLPVDPLIRAEAAIIP